MALRPTRRRFSIAEYHRMAEAGIFGEDDRLELIDGEVTEMAPIGHRHAACVARLTKYFVQSTGDAPVVWVQNPIRMHEQSEPQPDLALLHPRSDFYAARHPTPEDVMLLVEVAETSAEVDRKVKIPLYARSGILEVLLVDLEQETITVYRDPTARGYRTTRVLRRGDEVAVSAAAGRPLTVADILG